MDRNISNIVLSSNIALMAGMSSRDGNESSFLCSMYILKRKEVKDELGARKNQVKKACVVAAKNNSKW